MLPLPAPDRHSAYFEARGERGRMEFCFKPLAHPTQCSAAQCIKHSANHDGKRNDECQHQERIAAAARQHAIIDLKQIDGRREKKEIVAAAIRENESERPRAGPQRRLQRRPRRRHCLQLERWHQHCGPARDLKSEPSCPIRRLRDELRTGGIRPPVSPLTSFDQLRMSESSIWKYLESLSTSFRFTDSMLALK